MVWTSEQEPSRQRAVKDGDPRTLTRLGSWLSTEGRELGGDRDR